LAFLPRGVAIGGHLEHAMLFLPTLNSPEKFTGVVLDWSGDV
jgi:hypothetical protein